MEIMFTADVVIDDVVEKLAYRWPKSKIKAYLEDALITPEQRAEGKKIAAATMETILRAAEQKRNEIMQTPFAAVKADAITFYQSVIASDKASDIAKIKAQERLDLLLGIEKLADGNESPEEQAAKARQALREAATLMGEPTEEKVKEI